MNTYLQWIESRRFMVVLIKKNWRILKIAHFTVVNGLFDSIQFDYIRRKSGICYFFCFARVWLKQKGWLFNPG